MRPEQLTAAMEDRLLGGVLGLVLLAIVVALWLWWEWQQSAEDRRARAERQGRIVRLHERAEQIRKGAR